MISSALIYFHIIYKLNCYCFFLAHLFDHFCIQSMHATVCSHRRSIVYCIPKEDQTSGDIFCSVSVISHCLYLQPNLVTSPIHRDLLPSTKFNFSTGFFYYCQCITITHLKITREEAIRHYQPFLKLVEIRLPKKFSVCISILYYRHKAVLSNVFWKYQICHFEKWTIAESITKLIMWYTNKKSHTV